MIEEERGDWMREGEGVRRRGSEEETEKGGRVGREER